MLSLQKHHRWVQKTIFQTPRGKKLVFTLCFYSQCFVKLTLTQRVITRNQNVQNTLRRIECSLLNTLGVFLQRQLCNFLSYGRLKLVVFLRCFLAIVFLALAPFLWAKTTQNRCHSMHNFNPHRMVSFKMLFGQQNRCQSQKNDW